MGHSCSRDTRHMLEAQIASLGVDGLHSEWEADLSLHLVGQSKGAQDPHAGTLLLLHVDRLVLSHIVEHFDPAKRWAGRIGGIIIKHPVDHTFITAYAPQKSASEIDRQLFTEL